MWLFFTDEEKTKLKCFVSIQDIFTNFIDNVPFCYSIHDLVYLGAEKIIDIKEDESVETSVKFSSVRCNVDFVKQDSVLKSILMMMVDEGDLGYVPTKWPINHTNQIQDEHYPNVKAVEFVVKDGRQDANLDKLYPPEEGYDPIYKILGEIHYMQNGRQYFVPRFAFVSTSPKLTRTISVQFIHKEDEDRHILATHCKVDDFKSGKSTTFLIEYPMTYN